MKTFEQSVQEYFVFDQQEKAAKDAKKPLNAIIKDEMKSRDVKTVNVGDIKVTYAIQDRSDIDKDKLVAKLKELGLTDAIKTVEVPDDAIIERMIYNEQLDPAIVQSCVIPKFVETLTVKGAKSK